MEKRRTNNRNISPPGWTLLSRLNKAVKKINFLLSLNMRRWELSDAIRTAAVNQRRKKKKQQRRFLSFNEKVGLQGYAELLEDDHHNNSRPSSTGAGGVVLDRTCSLTDQQDVDKRAENFIANFRRGLLLERQVSLNLGYCRLDSFG